MNILKTLNQNDSSHSQDELDDLDFQNEEDLLNSKITESEVLTAISTLKNGKSPGEDRILNEYIKTTKTMFLPLHTCSFNVV